MKTYSNSEVMMLLEENPKLRFESEIDGEFVEMYANGNIVSYIYLKKRHCDIGFKLDSRCKWKLIEQPVTWYEVLKSDKKVKIEHKLINKNIFGEEELEDLRTFHELDEVMYLLCRRLSTDKFKTIIKEGKWYLKQ